ncbi:hypothetical protein DFH05DRAFT_1461558 [Lentinula detonsa]|uniref:Myb/SANT-like domain-containing protein n=1 Tax=Lentinula detonsa TaxID=2804962 RepID=A0A9W8TW27_9AGAR|nr:hypothetical protein DFH05DRAFT_1461558 [Lentinula detonsa]
MSEPPEPLASSNDGASVLKNQPKTRPRRKRKEEPAQWNIAETKRLLDFLFERRSEAGEGFSFKLKTFNAASDHLATVPPARGGAKDGKSCQSKYTWLKGVNDIIQKIKDHTGWGPWSDEHGAGITPLTSDSWDKFIAHYPKAKPFRNDGWPFLEKMERLIPYKPKGTNVYRPARGRTTGVVLDEHENEEEDDEVRERFGSEEWDLERLEKDVARDSDTDTNPEIVQHHSFKSSTSSSISSAAPKTPAPTSRKHEVGSAAATPLSSGKKPKGVEVLSGLLAEVSGIGDAMRSFLAPQPTDPTLLLTPARRDKAVKLVEKENDLPFEDAMAFCQILAKDKGIVDMYNGFTNPDWRRAFITSTLAQTGV